MVLKPGNYNASDADTASGQVCEITPEMVLAGLKRMRKSLDEFEQGSGDVVLVLEVLEAALSARSGEHGSCIESSKKQKILADTLRCL